MERMGTKEHHVLPDKGVPFFMVSQKRRSAVHADHGVGYGGIQGGRGKLDTGRGIGETLERTFSSARRCFWRDESPGETSRTEIGCGGRGCS
ncbi:hypothetical protein E2562_017003 [Oryza meyeriana var. granulata]|uniref:Uncharacterized protein n=1 Tax=Oryza meyeriana var. granulata TaxID=110450 RepID=A0A6G1ECS3_9ORYZ|nr:hypothetical protein E2562_017003 [Oryza meyeriana var. granulata]